MALDSIQSSHFPVNTFSEVRFLTTRLGKAHLILLRLTRHSGAHRTSSGRDIWRGTGAIMSHYDIACWLRFKHSCYFLSSTLAVLKSTLSTVAMVRPRQQFLSQVNNITTLFYGGLFTKDTFNRRILC